MLTRYGLDNAIPMLFVGVAIAFSSIYFVDGMLSILLSLPGFALTAFTLWFFRDPKRNIPPEVLEDKSLVISPADGKVVQIIDVEDKYYLNKKAKQISIFLSPLDVHVNRSPVSGEIEYYDYFPGKYLVAYAPKASEENEHSKIGEVKVGEQIKAGDQFGMMKFGSRMDIIVDYDTKFFVEVGQRVIGGETIIAQLPKK
jgi:phosphatidylserine decarboxylase